MKLILKEYTDQSNQKSGNLYWRLFMFSHNYNWTDHPRIMAKWLTVDEKEIFNLYEKYHCVQREKGGITFHTLKDICGLITEIENTYEQHIIMATLCE